MARRTPRRNRPPHAGVPAPTASPPSLTPARALMLPVVVTALFVANGLQPSLRDDPHLLWTFLGTASGLLFWSAALLATARRQHRRLAVTVALRPQHYVQACAQGAVFVYWGWYWRDVYAFAPLIVAQLLFAYAVDALLAWSRRDTYTLGFGPVPIILSINLFLWFKPDWFFLQLLMVGIGFAAKEFIRWTRDGRRTHIFNPSSFALSVFSVALIATGSSGLTWAVDIATTQLYPPHIYLLIFAVSLPGQLLFGVGSMTLSAVATAYGFTAVYAAVTGAPFFVESYLPIAVFLGMHLLFSDPSTSPRTDLGRLLFGVLYGLSVVGLFAILDDAGVPTLYDKLLGVPVLNLLIRVIDRIARSPGVARLDPTAPLRSLTPTRRNLAYMATWAALFIVMQALSGTGVALARADILLAGGRVADSIAHYRQVLDRDPDHGAAHTKLGYALIQVGRAREALPLLRDAVTLSPDDAEAHNNLGLALMQTGRVGEAVASLQQAAALDPDYAEAHYNRAHALNAMGEPEAAVDAFRAALRARPDWPTALGALAWVRATHRDVLDPDEALGLASRAAALSGHTDVAVLDALAAAYAAGGRFDEAQRTAEAAAALALRSAPALVDGIRARRDLYRAGRPVVID